MASFDQAGKVALAEWVFRTGEGQNSPASSSSKFKPFFENGDGGTIDL